MEYRRFGKTDWEVSEIGLGGTWFYGRPEQGLRPVSHGVSVVDRALELGVNYFDTAPLYGKGRSEEVMGIALEGVTNPHFIATKVGYYPEPFDYTRDTVWRGFEASLKRLRRDRVDLLQIHETEQAGWDGVFDDGMTLTALREIKDQGLATHIGITGSDLDLMARMLAECDEFVSVITFCKYDLLTQQATEALVPAAVDSDAALIAASPLHGGLLGSTRDQWKARGRFEPLYEKLEAIENLLGDNPEGISRTGLRYLLSDERVSIVLCGPSDIEELEVCASVSDGVHLPLDLIQAIEEA